MKEFIRPAPAYQIYPSNIMSNINSITKINAAFLLTIFLNEYRNLLVDNAISNIPMIIGKKFSNKTVTYPTIEKIKSKQK